MRYILLAVMVGVFAVSASAQTEIRLGVDSQKTVWFTMKEFPKLIAEQRFMTAMYTTVKPKGTHHVVFVEVDCSDNSIRLHGMDTYVNMKKVNEIEDVTEWAKPKGVAIKLYAEVCSPRSGNIS